MRTIYVNINANLGLLGTGLSNTVLSAFAREKS